MSRNREYTASMPELQQPGYLHVLINHLPIIGTAMGVLALFIGLALRSRKALLPGLVIVLISGISAWPVYVTGSDAYKSIRKISDDAGSDWLDEHYADALGEVDADDERGREYAAELRADR